MVTSKSMAVIVDTNDSDREVLISNTRATTLSVYDICDLLNQEYGFYNDK